MIASRFLRATSRVRFTRSVIVAIAATGTHAVAQTPVEKGRIIFDSLSSANLAANRLGDRGVRGLIMYVPPGYDQQTGRRYPTVYLIHGGRMSDSAWIGRGGNGFYHEWPDSYRPLSIATMLDSLIAAGTIQPMIIVMPDVRDKNEGGWLANSVLVGRWEDYFTVDLIGHVDRVYRTIPNVASRGIAGHSLGAFGAIELAFIHPDRFGAVFALSPCCVAFTEEFAFDDPSWKQTLERAQSIRPESVKVASRMDWAHMTAAMAFSPDSSAAPLPVAWPVANIQGQLVVNERYAARWRLHSPAAQVRGRAASLKIMRGIRIEHGTDEPMANLRSSARMLSDSLTALGIPHEYAVFRGGHEDHIAQRLRERLFPFFSAVLERGSSTTTR